MIEQLTDWINGNTKPVRKGVYETKPDTSVTFQHWNGEFWGYCAISPEYAMNGADIASSTQSAKWRGLASDPSLQKQEQSK